jgi:AGZA family xanthine/uracil permease-like MFS transporter
VITGLGCVSPLGNSVEDSWRHLLAGESGATEITQFDHSSPAYNVHFACELKDFDPTVWIDRKAARRMDRFAQMILAAARQAENDSGIDIAKEPERVGASVATGIGGLRSYQDCYDILLLGGIFTSILMMYRIKGAILIGIFITSIVSWPRPTAVTYFPHTDTGDAMFDYFKKVVSFHKLTKTGGALSFNYGKGKVWYALVTFLYVDILDTTGTLYSMAKFAGLRDPVTLDFENSTIAYCVDAFCISMGALLGTSPVTAFVESATGISEGGKTGITAMTTGIAFFISVFFAPIFSSIPPWATGGALVIVGSLMIRNVKEINWNYIGDAVPAFLTLIIIPLTYNIAYGVIAGILSYALLNGVTFILKKISGGRIVPPNYEEDSEPWVIPPGSILPGWVTALIAWKKGRTAADEVGDEREKSGEGSTESTEEQRHDEKVEG